MLYNTELDHSLVSNILSFTNFTYPLLSSKIDRYMYKYHAIKRYQFTLMCNNLKKWLRSRNARRFADELLYYTSPEHITWVINGNERIYTYEEQINIILSLCGMDNEVSFDPLRPKRLRFGYYKSYPVETQSLLSDGSQTIHALIDYF